ncbi:MAG: GNAT family N-acetyltransferase, partial [Terracoccus sp.]
AGQAEISVLRARGEIVAGLVALRANTQVSVHLMAADAKIWDIGAGTIMISELARREIARGTTGVNLGAGPNQFKLGWSEHLEFNHDFVVVGPRARNRARFTVYSQLSNLAALRRAGAYATRDTA